MSTGAQRVRGNGTFRISTSAEMTKSDTTSNTPIRPILYHACNSDNNVSDDDAGDGEVIFYKRYEDEADDGNNREFGSQSGSCSTCSLSVEIDDWRCVCVLPQLSELRLTSCRRHSRGALSDMRLESIEGPLDAQDQELRADGEDADEQPQQDEDEDKKEPVEPQTGDQDDDDLPMARNNQLSVEPIEMAGASSPLRRRQRKSSICCEPMVQYELIDSVCKSQQQLGLSRFARRPGPANPTQQYQQLTASDNSLFGSHRSDYEDDDDVMNIRSPVTQRIASGASVSHRQHHQSVAKKLGHEPRWTSEQLLQYDEVLGFLQEACATRSPQISIPGARLAQMEQLLRSLHPTT